MPLDRSTLDHERVLCTSDRLPASGATPVPHAYHPELALMQRAPSQFWCSDGQQRLLLSLVQLLGWDLRIGRGQDRNRGLIGLCHQSLGCPVLCA